MKVYKLIDKERQRNPQYSFVDSDDEQYHYIVFASDEWHLDQSIGAWCGTWAGLHSVEVSMLEVLVVTGWSQEDLEKRGVRKMERK